MTESEIKNTVIKLLKQIAPDKDPAALQPDDNIREKLEIDSFDSLRFIVQLEEQLAVTTPEEDYGKISTLRNLITYIMKKKNEPNA